MTKTRGIVRASLCTIVVTLMLACFASATVTYPGAPTPATSYRTEMIVAQSSPTTRFLVDYTRVFVPTPAQIKRSSGLILSGDWLVITFIRNEGRPMLNGANHWVPLVCVYQFQSSHPAINGVSTFLGCFNDLSSDTLPRTDTADPAFVAGSEVFFASRVITQVIRPTSASAPCVPTYEVFSQDEVDVCSSLIETQVSWLSNFFGVSFSISLQTYQLTWADQQRPIYDFPGLNPATMNESVVYPRHFIAINTYFQAFVTNNYAPFFEFFSPNMTFEVVDIANYSGAQNVYNYQFLADFTVSDSISINAMNILHIVSRANYLFATVMMESSFPHTPGPLQIWNNKYDVSIEFDRYGNMYSFLQVVDVLAVVVRSAPPSTFNITSMCNDIQDTCTDAFDMEQFPGVGAQQYANVSSCITYLSSIPVNGPTIQVQSSGLSLACVHWHLALAMVPATPLHPAGALHHCVHVGSLKVSPSVTPCQNF